MKVKHICSTDFGNLQVLINEFMQSLPTGSMVASLFYFEGFEVDEKVYYCSIAYVAMSALRIQK